MSDERSEASDELSRYLSMLERFYGTSTDTYTAVEAHLTNLFAIHGNAGIALIMSLQSMCKDYNELRKLFGYVSTFMEKFGAGNPLIASIIENPEALSIKKLRLIYCIIHRDIYSDRFQVHELGRLLDIADEMALNENNFDTLADLIVEGDVGTYREMVILLVQYPHLAPDKDMVKKCTQLLKTGEFAITHSYVRVWDAAVYDAGQLLALGDSLYRAILSGGTRDAKNELLRILAIPENQN